MNSAELQFILRMKDEATATLNRVGGSLNNAGKGAKQFRQRQQGGVTPASTP